MITYHYTPHKNLYRISSEGLVPYLINRTELAHYFKLPIMGIWLWKNNLEGLSEFGAILIQMAMNEVTRIAKLKVEIDFSKILKKLDNNVWIEHEGFLNGYGSKNGKLVYHKNERAVIYTETIKPSDIELIKVFDIDSMLYGQYYPHIKITKKNPTKKYVSFWR